MSSQFDRVHPRSASPRDAGDDQGKAALFSPLPGRVCGRVVMTCSACHRISEITYVKAVRLALPSLHLPILRSQYPSWMRCPSCDRRTWMRLTF